MPDNEVIKNVGEKTQRLPRRNAKGVCVKIVGHWDIQFGRKIYRDELSRKLANLAP